MRYLAVAVLLSACMALIACSMGPAPPRPGSPAFLWAEAKTAFHAGDCAKANENLNNLLAHDNEFTAKAQPWALVVSSGIANGMMELADAYKEGRLTNPDHPVALVRLANDAFRDANSAALPGVEIFRSFVQKNKDPQILLAFEYPPVNASEPAALSRVTKGNLLNSTDADALRQAMMQRGVVSALARVVGEPEDSLKVPEMFKAGTVQVPRERFLFGMAELLYDQAQLYDRKHINDPRRANIFCTEATNALKGLPEDKPLKELLQKIQRLQKTMPAD